MAALHPTTARTALRTLLCGAGAVALGTGSAVAVRGSAAIPGGRPIDASTDSVLRFYGVWWAATGAGLLRAAAAPERHRRFIRCAAAAMFAGGAARAGAWRESGTPHPLFQALTAVELAAAPALLAAQHRAQEPAAQQTR